MTYFPDHTAQLKPEILEIIARAAWKTASSVEHVPGGAHQYVVIGKREITDTEFWLVVNAIKAFGRREEWQAPEFFYDSGKRPKYISRYLYAVTEAGHHAYWFTWPPKSIPMLNRESTDIQIATPTRRVIEEQLPLTEPAS